MRIRLALLLLFLQNAYLCPTFAGSNTNGPNYVATNQYAVMSIEGWLVHVNKHLLSDQAILGSKAIALLKAKLQEIERQVPSEACAKLKMVPIWLGVNDGYSPCSEYHPSRVWLATHGYNPDKAEAVEIGNASRFLEWSQGQPSMVLHELSHAYYFRYLGYAQQNIDTLYQEALNSGRYNSVPRNNGQKERAYAMTNAKEYFAESCEAFFGINDFYPYNREQLRQFDPAMYNLLCDVWGVR